MSTVAGQQASATTSRSLIDALPLELFLNVVGLTLDRKLSTYYEQLNAIRSVSKFWKAVIDSSPQFFSVINFKHELKWTSFCLQLAKGAPLSVTWDDSNRRMSPGSLERSKAFSSRLRPHVHQVTRFEYVGPGGWHSRFDLDFLAPAAASLRHLSIRRVLMCPGESEHFFRRPELTFRSLVLDHVAVQPEMPALHYGTLSQLWLPLTGLTFQEVDSILQDNPQLVDLTLENIHLLDVDPSTATPIVLSKLKNLKLLDSDPTIVVSLLDVVEFPQDAELLIECSYIPILDEEGHGNIMQFLTNVDVLMARLRRNISFCDSERSATLRVDDAGRDRRISLQVEPDNFQLCVRNIYTHDVDRVLTLFLERFRDILEESSVEVLWSDLESAHAYAFYDLIEAKIPTIHSITIQMTPCKRQNMPYAQYLSGFDSAFPNLQRIRITYLPIDVEDMEHLVHTRCHTMSMDRKSCFNLEFASTSSFAPERPVDRFEDFGVSWVESCGLD